MRLLLKSRHFGWLGPSADRTTMVTAPSDLQQLANPNQRMIPSRMLPTSRTQSPRQLNWENAFLGLRSTTRLPRFEDLLQLIGVVFPPALGLEARLKHALESPPGRWRFGVRPAHRPRQPRRRDLLEAGSWLTLLLATVLADLRQFEAARSTLHMARELAAQIGHAEVEGWTWETATWMAATNGHLREAEELAGRGIEVAQASPGSAVVPRHRAPDPDVAGAA